MDCRWLALEVTDLGVAEFYRDHLDLSVRAEDDTKVRLAAGTADLVVRRPEGVPRGGLHTHYALSIPGPAYDDWYDRLSATFDLHEEQFGPVRSLYFDDPAGNCVELMGDAERGGDTEGGAGDGDGDETGDARDGIVGMAEVVLEVRDLDRAVAFYRDLGCEAVDRGSGRRRVRLSAGAFDLELWEPHLGIAGARGAVHVDLGITADPDQALAAVGDRARGVERVQVADGRGGGAGVRLLDPDGHTLTFVR